MQEPHDLGSPRQWEEYWRAVTGSGEVCEEWYCPLGAFTAALPAAVCDPAGARPRALVIGAAARYLHQPRLVS